MPEMPEMPVAALLACRHRLALTLALDNTIRLPASTASTSLAACAT